MKKIIVLISALILFPCYSLFSQGGSNYSTLGLGDIHHSVGAGYDAMAGTSIAVPFDDAINTRNPAMWSKVLSTRFQSGYRFNQHISDDGNSTLWQNNGKINGFFIIFSIDTSMGLAASLGVTPYSSVNYYVSVPVSSGFPDLTADGSTTQRGVGGLNSGYLGASIDILDNLSIGAEVFVNFGKTETQTETYFTNTEVRPSYNTINDTYSGYGFKGGVYYNLYEGLSIGAFYEKQAKLGLDREIVYGSYYLDDTSFSCSRDLNMPDAYGVGLSLSTGKFVIGTDISFQDFTDFNYQESNRGKFKNSMLLSAGVARLGSRSAGAEYLDQMTYKFGLGYQELYYELEGNNINEMFGSVGITLPLPGNALINAALVVGKRGISKTGFINETFAKFTVDLSIGETWFKPFRRDF